MTVTSKTPPEKASDPAGSPGDATGKSERYWAIVRRQYRKDRLGMAGLWVFLGLLLLALLAPLLANEVPIVARYDGDLCFPAFPTYLDALPVPVGIADWLRREVTIGGNNIFSEAYPILKGRSWKDVIRDGFDEGDWYLPPLVFYGYKEISDFKRSPGHVGPSGTHWLGTDGQGRDVLARLIHGTIISLSVGVVAVSIYTLIGVVLGLVAGYFGGWVDMLLSRVTEIVICFPSFFLIITVIAFLPRSIFNIMIVIGLTSWTGIFRLMRGEVLKVKQLDYCSASRALGTPAWRIMWKHLLPNTLSPILVTAAFGIAAAILVENSLSFLGFGVAPPTASWGEIVSQGRNYVGEGLFHLVFAPGVAIFVTVTTFNLIGQALRDAMDPRLRQ